MWPRACCLFPGGFDGLGTGTVEEKRIVAANHISKSMAASKAFSGTISSKKHTLEKIQFIFPEIFTIHASGAFRLRRVVPRRREGHPGQAAVEGGLGRGALRGWLRGAGRRPSLGAPAPGLSVSPGEHTARKGGSSFGGRKS